MDVTIIGAGVVGLSIARRISSSGRSIAVLEKEPGPGRGISSRSSEVIHAGIYYPSGSLKARLCVRGAALLYEFCTANRILFSRIGKAIVAAFPEEEPSIADLYSRGMDNGVEALKMLDRKELLAREPHVGGTSALYSPNTGIVDSHQIVKRLEAFCLNSGVTIMYRSPVIGLEKQRHGFVCTVEHPDRSLYSFSSDIVINAAGLDSAHVASLAGIDIHRSRYRIFPVKGEYFRVTGGKHRLIHGLVYPSPEKNLTGLGIHATKDLAGALRLGPNAFYVDSLDFAVDPDHARDFYSGTRDLLPFLNEEDLEPDMAGIRPKLQEPGCAFRDFVISHEAPLGLPGLVNLIGIESPGLTSCLAIGEYVEAMLKEDALL